MVQKQSSSSGIGGQQYNLDPRNRGLNKDGPEPSLSRHQRSVSGIHQDFIIKSLSSSSSDTPNNSIQRSMSSTCRRRKESEYRDAPSSSTTGSLTPRSASSSHSSTRGAAQTSRGKQNNGKLQDVISVRYGLQNSFLLLISLP